MTNTIRRSEKTPPQSSTLRLRKESATSTTTWSFKVSIEGDASIWRVVELRDNQSLGHLHEAIQQAFEWGDDHLYAFFMGKRPWQGQSYSHPAADGPSAEKARLGTLGLKRGQKFLYLFDFGDEWLLGVKVLAPGLVEPGARYPRIVDSHGEAPSQYGDEDDDWDDE